MACGCTPCLNYCTEEASALKRQGYDKFRHYRCPNPYLEGKNYLEMRLSQADINARRLEAVKFKRQRSLIVEHLQQHYRRVIAAGKPLQKYLDNAGHFGDIADREAAELVILIEDYAAAFNRDQNLRTRALFRLQKERFDLVYGRMPREILLARLRKMLKDHNYVRFQRTFFAVTEDLNFQLKEIKEAWKNLFNCDEYDERCCEPNFDDLSEDEDEDHVDDYIDGGMNEYLVSADEDENA
ncbi:hypothetical protein CJF31_00008130 [Rutstroemia sp. NJR-2017a BVV2]|nr:hypothetical protein CJF31_00008130 [Rutstroemia sp. NJR-2017a BVV2]